jgi:hypothetical protein
MIGLIEEPENEARDSKKLELDTLKVLRTQLSTNGTYKREL